MFNSTLQQNWNSAIHDLSSVIEKRLDAFFTPEEATSDPANDIRTPDVQYLTHHLSKAEYLALLIGLIPHVQPGFFDEIIQRKFPQGGDFTQLGGVRGKQFRGFLPTGETVLFVLAGDELTNRFEISKLFNEDHFFAVNHILWLDTPEPGEPRMSGRLVIGQDVLDFLMYGRVSKPKFGLQFPAQLINTGLEWKDLILNEQTSHQLSDLQNYIKHGHTLLYDWNMIDRIKPGYRVLFYGPPGTGKTLAATLLGKYTGKDVYRIDLSMIVSKFIGETEKNLSSLFARAEHQDWILFFDEADALFGKRTGVKDAHDKYANQEVSYLLQRVEGYQGLVILASNFRDNIDEAFVRRFQSIIYFAKPRKEERLKIWKNTIPVQIKLDKSVSLDSIAEQYVLTGANIVNIVQQVCLKALAANVSVVGEPDLRAAIRKEFAKEEKML